MVLCNLLIHHIYVPSSPPCTASGIRSLRADETVIQPVRPDSLRTLDAALLSCALSSVDNPTRATRSSPPLALSVLSDRHPHHPHRHRRHRHPVIGHLYDISIYDISRSSAICSCSSYVERITASVHHRYRQHPRTTSSLGRAPQVRLHDVDERRWPRCWTGRSSVE